MDLEPISIGNYVINVRPKTMDRMILDMVIKQNEYKLNKENCRDKVFIDIGAHIGSFSFLTLALGAKSVHAFEAFPENYALTKINLKQFGDRASVYDKAVWRSDKDTEVFRKENIQASYMGSLNTGGEGVLEEKGVRVETIGLDTIIDWVVNRQQQKVDAIKIDVEGSEYPILMTSKKLNFVDRIFGEYHILNKTIQTAEVENYRNEPLELIRFLEENGFEVQVYSGALPPIGFFFANKKVS